MRRYPGLLLAVLLTCGVAAGLYGARYLEERVPIGTAYFAKVLCSGVFVSGRAADDVLGVDLAIDNPLVQGLEVAVDREMQAVTATFKGLFARTAVYREGLGCTLAIETSPQVLAARARAPATREPLPADLPWPAGSGPAEPGPPGLDAGLLERALDFAFEEPGGEASVRTRAVVVVHGGRLVAERYAPGFDAATPLPGWSMTKTVTNALVGILVGQGRLDLYAPAPVPEWHGAGDPRAAITLDQLLRMSSGLDFDETYGEPLADVQLMLFRRPSAGTFAAAKPLRAEPDGEWYYSSGTSNIVSRIVRETVEAAGEDYWSFPRRVLFDPLGMRTAVLEPDASGTFVGSSFCYASARDWARFGLLYLHDGVWNGERVLPEGWVEYSTTPTPGALDGRYGAHIWRNGSRRPELPADLYYMSGYEGQDVWVAPSNHAVIVRLGMTHDNAAWDWPRFLTRVLAALPERPPEPEPAADGAP